MAIIQKVKINNEWVPVSGSNVNSGGGITEEKEVYIGEEAPTDDGAKLWIDTDDEDEPSSPSGGNGGNASGGSGVATIYMSMGAIELTPEQISHNIKVREVFMDCYNNGGIPPIPQLVTEIDGTLFFAYYPHILMFDTTPIFKILDIEGMIALMEDGTLQELT